MGIEMRDNPMAGAFYGVMGKGFNPKWLATIPIQVGTAENGVRFDMVDVRVTDDPNKTFILGVDIMYGSKDLTMLPWEITLSGQIKIPLRREDLPWKITTNLKVPEQHRYTSSWDDHPWKPKFTPNRSAKADQKKGKGPQSVH